MDEYEFIERIGRGAHGTAYLLRSSRDGSLVVCKSVLAKHQKYAEREAVILSQLGHRRVVRLIEKISLKESTYLILEYANYGTVENMIEYYTQSSTRPSLALVWSLLSQVSDALYYIHSRNVIHRDIKPANILVGKFTARGVEHIEFKLCDFSLAVSGVPSVSGGHTVGTPFYMAPEIVAKKPYGNTVDVWALGVVLHELLALRKPFTGTGRDELYGSILHGSVDTSALSADPLLNSVVKQCLSRQNRPSARQLARLERARLALTVVELKHRERRIEELERQITDCEAEKRGLAPHSKISHDMKFYK